MQNNELETIAAAMQEALHRAYALGRTDALRRVVEMVQSDELGSKTVALLGHSEPALAEPAPAQLPHLEAEVEPVAVHSSPDHNEGAHNDNAAAMIDPQHEGRSESKPQGAAPSSMKDFLLDYLYPLGAKK